MIHVSLPTSMHCEDEKCQRAIRVGLVLNAAGNFNVHAPPQHGWQIGMSSNGTLLTRCPAHHQKIEQPPPVLELRKH